MGMSSSSTESPVFNDIIVRIILLLDFFVIIFISVGDAVRVFVMLVEIVLVRRRSTRLNKSNLASSISTATESEVFYNFICRIGSVLDLLVIC
jgi:hypothetical protein